MSGSQSSSLPNKHLGDFRETFAHPSNEVGGELRLGIGGLSHGPRAKLHIFPIRLETYEPAILVLLVLVDPTRSNRIACGRELTALDPICITIAFGQLITRSMRCQRSRSAGSGNAQDPRRAIGLRARRQDQDAVSRWPSQSSTFAIQTLGISRRDPVRRRSAWILCCASSSSLSATAGTTVRFPLLK